MTGIPEPRYDYRGLVLAFHVVMAVGIISVVVVVLVRFI